jgi:hypothetical protein
MNGMTATLLFNNSQELHKRRTIPRSKAEKIDFFPNSFPLISRLANAMSFLAPRDAFLIRVLRLSRVIPLPELHLHSKPRSAAR